MGGVANYRIWAPWRLEYLKDASKDTHEGCIFCTAPAEDDDRGNLIVHRGERCYVILNKFPYTNGHLMVAPDDHLATLPDLDAETVAEMMALAQKAITVLDEVNGPQGITPGSTRAESPARATRTTSTSTSCRGGPGTPTTCRCSRTRG